jgi:hypothetical protein
MGGSKLQLVTKGVETLYLTNNPQITQFKIIYRRHTNFSLFDTDLRFKGNVSFGNKGTLKIKNIGDILYGLSLVVDLPDIKLSFDKPSINNIKSILNRNGISWTHTIDSSDLTLNPFITTDTYNNDIIPLINSHLLNQISIYSDYNNFLSDIDHNYIKSPNVYTGKYYLLDSNEINHQYVSFPIDTLGYSLTNQTIKTSNDIYVFLDSTVYSSSGVPITITPNNDLGKFNDNIFYATNEFLTGNSGKFGEDVKYFAVKLGAIIDDFSNSQIVTLTDNIFTDSNNNVELFKITTSDGLYKSVSNSSIKKDIDNFNELVDGSDITDEFNEIYLFYDVNGVDISSGTINFGLTDSRILNDSNSNVIYCSKNFLNKYSTTNSSSGDYIAVNRNLFLSNPNSNIDVNLTTNAYIISGSYFYFPNNILTESEKMYVLVNQKELSNSNNNVNFRIQGILSNSTSNIINLDTDKVKFISSTTLKDKENITVNDSKLKVFTYSSIPSNMSSLLTPTTFDYIERVDIGNIELSKFNKTNKYVLIDKTTTTINSSNSTVTFPKTSIHRESEGVKYNFYTDKITRKDTIIDKNIPFSKFGSNKMIDSEYKVIDIDGVSLITKNNSYIFLIKTLSHLFNLTDVSTVKKVMYKGLIALLYDVKSSNRNIKLDNIDGVKLDIYLKYIDNILNVERAYDNYLYSYSVSDRTDSSVILWTDPMTSIQSNKTVHISQSRENVLFYHILDMANYNSIPIKSTILIEYFNFILDLSYNDRDSYTLLDSYIIFKNFINNSSTLFPTFLGYYNPYLLTSISEKLTTAIRENYKSNTEVFYQLINTLQNVTQTGNIHTSVVYQYQSTSSNSNRVTYGLSQPNGDSRHIINIVDNAVRVSTNNDTTIYIKSKIEEVFDKFLESIRTISSTPVLIDYFNKLVYWNDCMLSSQISHITKTSMRRTLEINSQSVALYQSAFGTNRVILSHLPYALVQNIPYAIEKIILSGGLFNITSEIFAFPQITSNTNKSRVVEVLKTYLGLELSNTNFTETYQDGSNTTINKKTLIESLEDDMFKTVIGNDRTDINTYYNKDYFVSLKSATDIAQTKYIIIPFTIEKLKDISEDTVLNFPEEKNLTALDYIIKKFKRIYKKILNDFVEFIKNGHFTDSSGGTLTIEDLTDNETLSEDLNFSFVDKVYDKISDVLNTYINPTILTESIYSNTFSIYDNSQIFTELRNTNLTESHNYRLLDIQSSIWNIIQKQNIRAFNELLYDGLLSRNILKLFGGNNLLGLYDKLVKIISTTANTPTIYTDEYTDTTNNLHTANYNTSVTNLSPTGKTGIDYYRLRLTTEYDELKKIMSGDINYYLYLLDIRYHKLKKILNIKSLHISNQFYKYNTVELLVKILAEELVKKHNIDTDENSTSMTDIIGFKKGQETSDFKNVALDIYQNKLSVLDIIKSGGSGRGVSGEGTLNSGDNIYNKIFKISQSPATNPYSETLDKNLYIWFNTFNSVVDMGDVFTYFIDILEKITPQTLFSHKNRNNYFKNYESYSDGLLLVLDAVLHDTIKKSTLNDVITGTLTNNSNTNTDDNIYNNTILNIIKKIEQSGNNIFNLSVFTNGGINYKIPNTVHVSGITKIYRYKIFAIGDIKIDGSIVDIKIKNLLMSKKPKFRYVDELGHRLIEYVNIQINDQEIDCHTDELLSHIASVNLDEEHRRGYNINIGNTTEMTTMSSDQRCLRRLTIPFKFWFCNDSGNGISLINLLHSDLIVNIKLRDINDVLIKDDDSYFEHVPRIRTHLLGNFVYLDEEERLKMSKSKLEYLITKYQYSGDNIFMGDDIYDENKIRLTLNFSDPAKYIYWKFNYSNIENSDNIANWRNKVLIDSNTGKIIKSMNECKLKFNGRERELYKDYTYYNIYHPFIHGIYNLKEEEFVYSFALNPLKYQPSGSASLTNIEDFTMIMKLHSKAVEELTTKKTILNIKIWAKTINILSMISGIGGLRFFG